MNSKPFSTGILLSHLVQLQKNRQLIMELTWREIIGRYRGSNIGLLWALLHPIIMLLVYTFVFSVIFKARWGLPQESQLDFAIVLFVGLILHGFLAEALNKSPMVILQNSSYVKKVIFPLEILPWIIVLSTLFHSFLSVIALIFFEIIFRGGVPATVVIFPIFIIPLVIATTGLSLLLASIGTYVRDVGQFIGILTTILMFLSPVFYPVSSLPDSLQFWMSLNPLAYMIEQGREILIFGNLPSLSAWLIYLLLSLVTFWFSVSWFQFTRDGFADVL